METVSPKTKKQNNEQGKKKSLFQREARILNEIFI